MKQEKISPGACDTGANENCVLDGAAYSKNHGKTQQRTIPPLPDPESGITIAEWSASLVEGGFFKAVEVVGGDIGPIAAIGSPRVCVGFGEGWSVVWCERRPWGWSDPYKLFLKANSRAACTYAVALAKKIKAVAETEQARKDRIREAKLRERFGGVL